MKEWDLESYHRKFSETITIFKNRVGQLVAGFVTNIEQSEDGPVFYINNTPVPNIEPEYYRFENRIYQTRTGHIALTRRFNRQWRIGLCRQNHDFTQLHGLPPNLTTFDPLLPLKIDVEQALKTQGPISNQLYITPSRVLYLKHEVGFRKGSKFYVNESVWQEVNDSLRGFQCSINK